MSSSELVSREYLQTVPSSEPVTKKSFWNVKSAIDRGSLAGEAHSSSYSGVRVLSIVDVGGFFD